MGALLGACREAATKAPSVTDSVRVVPSRGTVEVLNGTPVKGVAGEVAERLRAQGFDVVKIGNAPERNHSATLVVERRPGASTASEVARTLGLARAYPYRNENLLVDATVYVGRDIKESEP
jgi:hypothetical protein